MNPPKPRKERLRKDVRRAPLDLLEQAAGHDLNAVMLEQSGAPQRSLRAEHGRNAASTGANLIYAATHQFGAKKGQFANKKGRPILWSDLPARPFFGVHNQERKQIRAAILNHLRARPKRSLRAPATASAATTSAPKPSPSSGKTTATIGPRQPHPATGP